MYKTNVGIFQVMRKPFTMLLSIHAFIRRGNFEKQVPLLFATMTGRKTADYIRVLAAIRRALQERHQLQEVVVDYEMALWKAVRHVFPETQLKGCSFHWGQAVWRKIQVGVF